MNQVKEFNVVETKKEPLLKRGWNWVKTHKLETALIVLGVASTGASVYNTVQTNKRIDDAIDACNRNFKYYDDNFDKFTDKYVDNLVVEARSLNDLAKVLDVKEEDWEYCSVLMDDGSRVTPFKDSETTTF